MRISDWSSDVCSSDLHGNERDDVRRHRLAHEADEDHDDQDENDDGLQGRPVEVEHRVPPSQGPVRATDAAQLSSGGAVASTAARGARGGKKMAQDRKSTRLNSSH